MTLKEYLVESNPDVYPRLKDCVLIQAILLNELKVNATIEEIQELWSMYSGSMGEYWLPLPKKDEQIITIILEAARKFWGD